MLRSIPLRLKLLAALVLPMLVVGFYLYVDITDSVERRDVAAAQRSEVDAFQAVSEVSSAIGVEQLLINARDANPDQLAAARAATDAAYEALRTTELQLSAERLQLIDGHYGTLLSIRETLGADPTEARLRANIELRNGEGRTGPNSTSLVDLAELPLDVLAAFEFDPAAIDDVATSSLVDDYFLVQRARADVRREASTLLRVSTLPGNLVDAAITESVSAVLAETDESLEVLAQLASIDVAGDVDSMLVAPAWTQYDAFRRAVDAVEVGQRADVDESDLRVAAGQVDSLLRGQSDDIINELERRASASVFDANRDVIISGLIGLWLLVGVGLLLRFLYRAIKRPLERLTEKAGHVARVELPAVIDGMRSGEIENVPEIERIPVESKDEVGTLVMAFNDMHRSAVDLAAGQANSRRVVADMFVNLGRRNQRLVGRLLNGLSMLEQHEQDADKLAALYDLDHTATRMRRNAESLLVLAGAGQARRWDEPVAIDDVARAAIGEVEGYQRVTIDVNGDERLDGGAVSDMTHLLAELVENALTFSPPNSPVEVIAGRTSSGYVIAVADNGIGMLPDQIEEVNGRIADAANEEETPSDFLGHYVVGRLAARHGVRVIVSEGPAGGVTARAWLPSQLLVNPSTLVDDVAPGHEVVEATHHLADPIDLVAEGHSTAPVAPEAEIAVLPTAPVLTPPVVAPSMPVMPPPMDPAMAPLGGTGPIDQALPTVPSTPLTPSSDATDFLASLEASGIQQRTSKLPDAGTTAPLPTITPAPATAPVTPTPASAAAAVPASAPAPLIMPRVNEPAPTEARPQPEPPRPAAIEPLSLGSTVVTAAPPAPAPAVAAAPAPSLADPSAAAETPFGTTRRTPGEHMPKTELLGSIAGSMGSIFGRDDAAAPRTPPEPGPTTTPVVTGNETSPLSTTPQPQASPAATDPFAADPERIRSALSGFQQGVARADEEQVER